MGRYCGPVCRLCRREGKKLFLKGERCYTSKCSVERREGGPGQHGRARQAFSDFKIQLREKQRIKRMYGLLERKFRTYYDIATRSRGVTGSQMLIHLEARLDNVVYKLGFASSRRQARQLVTHGHVYVNATRVNKPAFEVSPGDNVAISEKKKANIFIQGAMAASTGRMIPDWLLLDKDAVKGTVKSLPTREMIPSDMNEQLVVELYSK